RSRRRCRRARGLPPARGAGPRASARRRRPCCARPARSAEGGGHARRPARSPRTPRPSADPRCRSSARGRAGRARARCAPGGPLHVLVQPAQLAIIGGAAVGTLVMAAPGKMRGRLFAAIGKAFRSSAPTRDDYLDLLRLQYEVFSFMRKHGAVLLDDHLRDVHQSTIFRKYPSFLRRPVAVEFFRDALQQIVNGTASADELDVLLATEIETQ